MNVYVDCNTYTYIYKFNFGFSFCTGIQKIDGLYGSIVVRQTPEADPNSNLYDYDLINHVILLSDWMHEDAQERFPGRLAVNPGQDPESVLINGRGQFQVSNFTINFYCPHALSFLIDFKTKGGYKFDKYIYIFT